jgi:hypothetical protein
MLTYADVCAQDFGTSLSDAEAALRALAPVLPAEFVEVLGEEAGKHSQRMLTYALFLC